MAQRSNTDTAFYTTAIDNVIQLYADSLNENLRLYNGNEFTGNFPGVPGHPFFEFPQPQKGTVFYDGIRYPNVLLSYDIINDDVIFVDTARNRVIKLISQKVDWFSIQHHLFINVREDSNARNMPARGFYELLYEGAGAVLSKQKKQYEQALKGDETSGFIQWTWYYVRKGATFYAINNKHSLLAVCKDYKSEVAKFIEKENLNFKKDPAIMIIKVMDYYTQLKIK
ncbi:MAG: hypothetical protein WKI04_15360 [Ferruginibacter sp.]